jgi:hypothetical protein
MHTQQLVRVFLQCLSSELGLKDDFLTPTETIYVHLGEESTLSGKLDLIRTKNGEILHHYEVKRSRHGQVSKAKEQVMAENFALVLSSNPTNLRTQFVAAILTRSVGEILERKSFE